MSRDVYKIFETMNHEELKTKVALQCSPLLTGIKISNLLIVDVETYDEVVRMFEDTVISYSVLYESAHKITFLLYRQEALNKYLETESVQRGMNILGYENEGLEVIFQTVSSRYTSYMTRQDTFPHELGLLLGYPVEDVLGFIEHEGKDFLYSGYWKVYSNLAESLKIFERYNQSKEAVIRLVASGVSVQHILEHYNNTRAYQESYAI